MSSRQSEKEQRKAERLEREQELSAQARRQRLLRRAGGSALGLVAIGAVIAAVALGGGGARSDSAKAEQLLASSKAAFGQHYQTLDQRRKAARIPTMMDTMSSSVHVHPRIAVWVDGKPMLVPANIGIDPTKDGMQMAGLHTHDSSGTIHVEGVVHTTLGQFFAIWGVPFSADRLGLYRAAGAKRMRMWVNGKPSGAFGQLELLGGQRITVSFGTDPKAPAS